MRTNLVVENLRPNDMEALFRPVITGIRNCWDSHCKSDSTWCNDIIVGEKDLDLIERVGNKNKHKSVLEHMVFTFMITGLSRATLQELARHRMASYSVKSTRYTLKELKNETEDLVLGSSTVSKYINILSIEEDPLFLQYIESLGITKEDLEEIDQTNILTLRKLKELLENSKCPNDLVKFALPECYRTNVVMTINARSLQNFLELRSSTHALWEIRLLAKRLYQALPEEAKPYFQNYITDLVF